MFSFDPAKLMPSSASVAAIANNNGKRGEALGSALSNYGAAGGVPSASIMMDQVSSNMTAQSCRTLDASSTLANKRRSYVFNEASGRYERIIRKRKRKTVT